MGACKRLLDKRHKVEFVMSNWHRPLRITQRCHHNTHHATETQQAMHKQDQARWRQAEAEIRDLCRSNSAQVQTLADHLREKELEHQQRHTAQERQLQLEAQAFKRPQDLEQQAHSIAHEREIALRELCRQAGEQPQALKSHRNGSYSCLSSHRTRQRSMSSTPRC